MKETKAKYSRQFSPGHQRANNKGCVYTHILMAEKKLGRSLLSEECVHHIDENKRNNDLDNLMVFKTKADHTAFHQGTPAVEENGVWYCPTKGTGHKSICPVCNERYKDRHAKMCIDCWNILKSTKKSHHKVTHPSRDTLKSQIRIYSFKELGRMYGVSDKSVSKWCRYLSLPYLKKDIMQISDADWEKI